MKNVTISTTVPIDQYQEAQKMKWAHNELWLLGFMAKKNNPQLIERINSMEKANKDALTRIARLQNKVWALEEGVKDNEN